MLQDRHNGGSLHSVFCAVPPHSTMPSRGDSRIARPMIYSLRIKSCTDQCVSPHPSSYSDATFSAGEGFFVFALSIKNSVVCSLILFSIMTSNPHPFSEAKPLHQAFSCGEGEPLAVDEEIQNNTAEQYSKCHPERIKHPCGMF